MTLEYQTETRCTVRHRRLVLCVFGGGGVGGNLPGGPGAGLMEGEEVETSLDPWVPFQQGKSLGSLSSCPSLPPGVV